MTNDTDQTVTAPTRRKPIDVRECCERWARWREQARYYARSPAASGGEYIGGRGWRDCPTCKGDGRMPGHLVGSTADYINGVPCPVCNGDKRVTGDLAPTVMRRNIQCLYCRVYDARTGTYRATGEMPDGSTCIRCQGGRRAVIEVKVHPATIRSTRHLGPQADPDKISVIINSTVLEWQQTNATYWLARVLVEEYCKNGTAAIKAQKMGVSAAWFSVNLKQAHIRLEAIISGAMR